MGVAYLASATPAPGTAGNFVLAGVSAGYRFSGDITLALSARQLNRYPLLASAGGLIKRRVFPTLTVHP